MRTNKKNFRAPKLKFFILVEFSLAFSSIFSLSSYKWTPTSFLYFYMVSFPGVFTSVIKLVFGVEQYLQPNFVHSNELKLEWMLIISLRASADFTRYPANQRSSSSFRLTRVISPHHRFAFVRKYRNKSCDGIRRANPTKR